MNRSRLTVSALVLLVLAACHSPRGKTSDAASGGADTVAGRTVADSVPAGARALLSAYPRFIRAYSHGILQLADGTRLRYDDGRRKDFVTRLDEADPEDMFFVPYAGAQDAPAYLADAGRVRCAELFGRMYGADEAAVKANLTEVEWFGQRLKFSSCNGADRQLRRVAEELKRHPQLLKYVKSCGTFYWRPVRGARRLSAHSYGIAIDIGVPLSNYWLWDHPGAAETDTIAYRNRFPHEIVRIFRRHGFIWGGAWYHYDTMHFEYRPEILDYAALIR